MVLFTTKQNNTSIHTISRYQITGRSVCYWYDSDRLVCHWYATGMIVTGWYATDMTLTGQYATGMTVTGIQLLVGMLPV